MHWANECSCHLSWIIAISRFNQNCIASHVGILIYQRLRMILNCYWKFSCVWTVIHCIINSQYHFSGCYWVVNAHGTSPSQQKAPFIALCMAPSFFALYCKPPISFQWLLLGHQCTWTLPQPTEGPIYCISYDANFCSLYFVANGLILIGNVLEILFLCVLKCLNLYRCKK